LLSDEQPVMLLRSGTLLSVHYLKTSLEQDGPDDIKDWFTVISGL